MQILTIENDYVMMRRDEIIGRRDEISDGRKAVEAELLLFEAPIVNWTQSDITFLSM